MPRFLQIFLVLDLILAARLSHATLPWPCGPAWSELDVSPYQPVFGVRSERFSTQTADAFELAEGALGVKIVRMVPKDGTPSYIIKQYPSRKQLPKFEKDWAAAQITNEIRESGNAEGTFYLAKTEDLRPQRLAMRVEDVPGKSLEIILSDRTIPPEMKRSLVDEFQERKAVLLQLLRKKFGEENLQINSSIWIRGSEITEVLVKQPDGATTKLLISPSQVVVSFDKTNPDNRRMTLVDSY